MDEVKDRYTRLTSSNLAAAKYEPEDMALFVVFTNGGHYLYSGVPQDVYDGLIEAESAGRYFHREIRNNYPAMKVEEVG